MGRDNGSDLVKRRNGSKIWHCNFTVKGRRFRDSLKTDDRNTAEILAAEIRKNALLGNLITRKPELSLTEALGRFWIEHGQFLTSKNVKPRSKSLERFLGKHTLLSEITAAEVVTYISERRVRLSPVTVNGELLFLNQVIKRARDLWGCATSSFKIRELLLPEPDYRQHILTPTEEDHLFTALRQDMQGMVWLAIATGLRLSNIIYLRWNQIKWELGYIEFRVKSKKKGGKIHKVPLTDFLIHLLEAEKGNHPDYVFTLIALKDQTNWKTRERFVEGQRYPYTRSKGWRWHWQNALKAAGLWEKSSRANFRFHDLRHTAATRLYTATRNLKLVQKFLGHANIQMTARYLGVDVDDVRDGMDQITPAHFRHTPSNNPENPAQPL